MNYRNPVVRMVLLMASLLAVTVVYYFSCGQPFVGMLLLTELAFGACLWWWRSAPAREARRRQGHLVEEVLALSEAAGSGSQILYVRNGAEHFWVLYGGCPSYLGAMERLEKRDSDRLALSELTGIDDVFGVTKMRLVVDSVHLAVRREVFGFTLGGVPARLPAEPEKKVSLAGRIVTAVRLERYARHAQFADVQEIRDAMEYIRRADLVKRIES